ncbi:COPII coat assembly protein SEC16 [Aspergillus candidus]|uniref:Protein transport protein sec16 n=1 Tax=Aspergillus candidus TaxID=41067 RepID=A0A2I2FKG8_ASPCN|nr:hypothetical protein BDW47DRAFT_75425 [Aspergillus candidus]PLB41113.1 hypothetical protein BDW47DRAFT_75425 [Aspergillus candidus]
MAHNDEVAAWNPALRAEDHEGPAETASADAVADSIDSTPEDTPVAPDASIRDEEAEAPIQSASADTGTPETSPAGLVDSEVPQNAGESLSQEETVDTSSTQDQVAPPANIEHELAHEVEESQREELKKDATGADYDRQPLDETLESSSTHDQVAPPATTEHTELPREAEGSQHEEPKDDATSAEHEPQEQEVQWPPNPEEPLASTSENAQELKLANDTTPFHPHVDTNVPTAPHEPSTDDGHNFWGSPTNGDAQDGFFDQLRTQTKPIYMPPEAESRFEEGVPLLDGEVASPVDVTPRKASLGKGSSEKATPEEASPEEASPEKAFSETASPERTSPKEAAGDPISNIFNEDDDEDDAFFSEVQKSPQQPKISLSHHITRKSTSQVLESLDIPSVPPSDDVTSPTTQEFNSILAAAASENQTQNQTQNQAQVQGHDQTQSQAKRTPSEEDLAAAWEAELAKDEKDSPDEDLAARWEAALDDDDDLLLEDETSTAPQETDSQHVNNVVPDAGFGGLSSPLGTPQGSVRAKAPSSYTPHQPSIADLVQGVSPAAVPQATSAPQTSYFTQLPSRPNIAANRGESFAERPKEGYKSPYDLPEDLTLPRRPHVTAKAVVTQPGNMPPPPPRQPSIPGPPPRTSGTPTPPLAASPWVPSPGSELPRPPPTTQSRPASSGRYTPAVSAAPPSSHPPPPLSQAPPPVNPYASFSPALQPNGTGAAPPTQSPLQSPESLDPYASTLASNTLGAPTPPSTASRYSPKPPGSHLGAKPPASPRYSPAPPPSAAPPPPRNRYASQPNGVPSHGPPLPFQPRTSSPLAYHEKVSYQPQGPSENHALPTPPAVGTPANEMHPVPNDSGTVGAAPPTHVDPSPGTWSPGATKATPGVQQPTSPPKNRYAPSAYVDEFSKRVTPMGSPPPVSVPSVAELQFAPPRRSQTQSPGQQTMGPRLSVPSLDPQLRPASAHGTSSPTKAVSPYAPSQVSVHNRTVSQTLDFIPPSDGQELDPLQRWKGAPIVKFAFGGTVTSCFPQHIPRYTAGQTAPKIKPSPGEVKLSQLNDWIPAADSIVQHPGPLRSKSKKKDLLAWLSSKIAAFENEGIAEAARLHPDPHKRHDEKVLLWKIVRLLVEHDGNLEGSAEAKSALRTIIFPNLPQNTESDQTYGAGLPTVNHSPSPNASSQPDAADLRSVDSIRNNLVDGDREKAVWNAVDNRLWGHAMIIASTLDKSVWKQVVQEFVRREVRSSTSNTESLAALYEIFAGNVDESIDELVPPSARAGLQMISKVEGQGPAKGALDGLESWRDTLGLVLSNRSPGDHTALLALGRLLLSYGRAEAAHICFIFSHAPVFGGADDPQAGVVLLGVDHQHLPSNGLNDDDAILLTEAYEFAVSILAGSQTSTFPHLLAFKLIHGWSLADRGRTSEAQQYCDAIEAALKASTKPSGYHNQQLFFGVEELSARLRQTTTDAGSSWISRPSMEKVSGSMWSKFNKFVSGEDSDAVSTGSGKMGEQDVGPFANLSGTPTVSRSPSVTDLYGSYPVPPPQSVPGSGPSRYQPANPYAPNPSPEHFRGGRSSLDSQRSSSFQYPSGQRRGSQDPATPIDSSFYQGGSAHNSPSAMGYQSTPPQTSYMPLAPVDEDTAAQSYPGVSIAPVQGSHGTASSYQPTGYEPVGQPLSQIPPPPTQTDGGYMPPFSGGGGYEPPSIDASPQPVPEITEESVDEPQKNKPSIMDDDDDDIAARAAAVQKAEKERKDREADEAFKKAAEEDAKKPGPAKKGWFGGWFGGGKKESDNAHPTGGPIRAKLGEENSFYYDTELKKWVNKKDPNSATVARATPPPPKAMPSRTASGSSAAPSQGGASPMLPPQGRPSSSAGAPPSLSSSPGPSTLAPPPMLGTTPRSVSTGAPLSTPPDATAGPPRPTSSLSHASSIDDLLGAPTARRGAGPRGKKKGRYVDVMAK